MKRRTEKREVAGLNLSTTQLPVMRATLLVPRLGRVLAPILAMAGGNLKDAMNAEAGPLLQAALGALTEQELRELIRDLLAGTTAEIEGKLLPLTSEANIELAFDGVVQLFAACKFAVEVNFHDFFTIAGAQASESANPAKE